VDDMTILLIDRQAGVGPWGNMAASPSWHRTLQDIRGHPEVAEPVTRGERLNSRTPVSLAHGP
jgi:hypothetical protein